MGETFRSFRVPNFRLWAIGQSISLVGFFGQAVAQVLLVLELSENGAILGIATALTFTPILVVGSWAGVLSDRWDKRRIMLGTQTAMMLGALTLGILVLTDLITVTAVLVLAAVNGTAWAFDQPCRRTFVTELVNDGDAVNAVSLNSAINNSAKVVGPAVAGALAAMVGLGWCFVLNALTSLIAIAALLKMDPRAINVPPLVTRSRGQIREGFAYVWTNVEVRVTLGLLAAVGVLSFNWNVLLPLLATRDLHGGAPTYALLLGAMSIGSLGGTLWLARGRRIDTRFLGKTSVAYGIASLLLAVAPNLALAACAGFNIGAASMVLVTATVAEVQLGAPPGMRGRVMALLSMVLLGSVGLGGPMAGWMAERYGARVGFGFGAVVAIVVGLAVLARRVDRQSPTLDLPPTVAPSAALELGQTSLAG